MSGPFGPNDTPGPGEGHSSDPTQQWTGQQPADPTQQWGGQQPAGQQQQWSQPGQTSWPPQSTGNADPTQQWGGQQPAGQQWAQGSGTSWPQQQPAQAQPWEATQQQWGQPPQQPQQWNQSGQWSQEPQLQTTGGKKSRRGLLIGGGIGVVVVIVVAVVLAVVFLGSDKLDSSAVQSGVQKVLKDSYGIDDVQNVSCPAGQEVKVGKTFTCSMKVGGEQKSVTIKITKSDGTYEVGRPN
ncbi:DUF4333 domain-containing protein [Nocardia macrotermitis]|uniref:DUF4333 domain-containing protein n=1 Tax=Nocardia macrotermitis TaxID=2585198 RepID=A0A7K0CUT3_9NOCA|nr:DUF4333 domain-containing protein [Nocardia macrotermitis]MQY17246.1 hypothetical protein [Nocardia macrotermitis]